jgi:hypothetical protein
MNTENKTGRQFNLEALLNAKNQKITCGFKCSPKTKMDLHSEALGRGLSLSEYIDKLLGFRHEEDLGSAMGADTQATSKYIEEIENLKNKIACLNGDVACLEETLLWYDTNPKLEYLWNKYDGQTFDLELPDGTIEPRRIDSPKDIYEFLLSSFK